MNKEAESLRALFDQALSIKEAAAAAGVDNAEDLGKLVKLGRVVSELITLPKRADVMHLPRFERVGLPGGEHIITRDRANRLEWDVTDFGGKTMNHADAEKACKELRTCGYSDWRMPTIRELLTLVDYEKSDPAIDKEFFPNCASSWYWTSTNYAPSSGCAWIVLFGGGTSNGGGRNNRAYVRAVRASQS